ncbi:MAG: hypothetical protein ACNYVW_07730, partial [Methanosarcinales archaeon]
MRVTILGGAGGMGQWFAAFFRDNGAEVKIVDKSAKTEAIAEEIGVQFLNTDISGRQDESQTEMIVDT